MTKIWRILKLRFLCINSSISKFIWGSITDTLQMYLTDLLTPQLLPATLILFMSFKITSGHVYEQLPGVGTLRTRPPGAASAHARVFFDFSEIFFRNFSIFRNPGPARTPPDAASAHARPFFDFPEIFFFSKLFHLPQSGPLRTGPRAAPMRMRETLRIGEFGSLLLSMMLILFKTLYFVMLIA